MSALLPGSSETLEASCAEVGATLRSCASTASAFFRAALRTGGARVRGYPEEDVLKHPDLVGLVHAVGGVGSDLRPARHERVVPMAARAAQPARAIPPRRCWPSRAAACHWRWPGRTGRSPSRRWQTKLAASRLGRIPFPLIMIWPSRVGRELLPTGLGGHVGVSREEITEAVAGGEAGGEHEDGTNTMRRIYVSGCSERSRGRRSERPPATRDSLALLLSCDFTSLSQCPHQRGHNRLTSQPHQPEREGHGPANFRGELDIVQRGREAGEPGAPCPDGR